MYPKLQNLNRDHMIHAQNTIIASLKIRQGKGQPIRADGPETHFAKAGTPTMGGLMILFGLIISSLLWANLSSVYVWVILLVTLGFGLIGFYDDYLKECT